MKPQNTNYKSEVERIFYKAPFISDLNIQLVKIEPGLCESTLELKTRHLQHDGYVHAGVQATIADHTAGAAAGSLIAHDELVLTAEFKINFLRAALGNSLKCQAVVLKPGRMLTVAESEVYCLSKDREKLVAKATVTLAVVKRASSKVR